MPDNKYLIGGPSKNEKELRNSPYSQVEGFEQVVHAAKSDILSYGIPLNRYQALEGKLEQLKQMARSYGLDKRYSLIWKKIQRLMDDQVITVAIVGGLNTGKSRLINQLLQKVVVPISNTPCTTVSVVLGYGSTESWMFVRPDGAQEKLSEQDFIAACRGKRMSNMSGYLQATENNPWLNESALRFIDTPSSDVMNDPDTWSFLQMVPDVIAVTINAVESIGMSEKEFFERVIAETKVPRIVAIVTHLDTISKEDRPQVLSHIQSKIQTIDTGIPVFVTLEETVNGDWAIAGSGMQSIRDYMSALKTQDSFDMRSVQIQQLLFEIASSMKETLMERRTELVKTRLSVQQKRADEEHKIRMSISRWEDLKDEIDLRENECKEETIGGLDYARRRISERLIHEFSRHSNPKEWIQNEWSYSLTLQVEDLVSRPLSRQLENRFNRDQIWVSNEMVKRFNWQARMPLQESRDTLTKREPDRNRLENISSDLTDMDRLRLISRAGAGGLTTIMVLLTMPIGALVSAVGFGMSELLLKQHLKDTQDHVAPVIERELENYFIRVSYDLENYIHVIYAEMKGYADLQRDEWTHYRLEQVKQWFEKAEPDVTILDSSLLLIDRLQEVIIDAPEGVDQ